MNGSMLPATFPGTQVRPHGAIDDLGTHERPQDTSDYHRDPGTLSWYQQRSQEVPHGTSDDPIAQGPRSGLMVPATITVIQEWPHGTSDDPRDTEA